MVGFYYMEYADLIDVIDLFEFVCKLTQFLDTVSNVVCQVY